MNFDKAVILARGLGSRMRKRGEQSALTTEQAATADNGVKAMIPIDRPFLDYVLSELAGAGYRRVGIVIGPEHDCIRRHYEQHPPTIISIDYVVQTEPLGTADAVLAAEDFAADDEFVVINSDTYYPPESLVAIAGLGSPGLVGFERDSMLAGGNISEQRVTKFAVIQIDDEGWLENIIEKPDEAVLATIAPPVCLSMNCWRFGPRIFEACRSISPSPRGELELPDAVKHAMEKLGERFRVVKVAAPVLDLTSRADISLVADRLAGREVRY